MEKLKRIIPTILLVLLGVYFIFVGVVKFISPAWVVMFHEWGYPDRFVWVIGASEVVLGIGVIVTRFRAISSAGLALIMIGASLTQIIHEGFSSSVLPILMFAICFTIAFFAYKRSAPSPTKSTPPDKIADPTA